MLNSLTSKFKSYIFNQQEESSRKRKRPLDESYDPDCEIVDVKRIKAEESPLGYNFFSKMADWVRNKTSWNKMFDFRPKEEANNRNGQLQAEAWGQRNFQEPRPEKVNGKGGSSHSRAIDGQMFAQGQRSRMNRYGNQQENEKGNQQRSGGHIVNGDGREIPPEKRYQRPNPDLQALKPSKKSYASVVKTTATTDPNSTVSHSTQTNGDPLASKDNQYSCSQRSLFSKKQDVHFTATETIRLDEKERYMMLLQQYTTVPLRQPQPDAQRSDDSWPALDTTKSHRNEETLLGRSKNQYIRNIDVSQTNNIPRHRVRPSHTVNSLGTSVLHRHISPIDMIKSAALSSSTVQSPTSMPSRPLLESTRVEKSHSGKLVSPDKDTTIDITREITTSPTDYRRSQYLSEDWATELMTKYSSSARERTKKIEEAELKARLYEERRLGKDEDMEKRLRHQLHIYEREPAVAEDLPVEEKEEEETLPEITAEMDDIINMALRGQPAGQVLVEGYRLQITRGDIATLGGLNWLNDEVINFYMNMLMERGEKENYPKCYAFNTFFYPKIMSGGQSTVRRWTKKIDIFSYDYIIIPVHLGMHWCLCIVDFKKKSIQYYDSMGGNNQKCLNAVKQYLCDESKDKKNQAFDLSGWTTEIMEDIPQQMNGSDCGMFACKFADYITRGANISFTQQHMPYFRRRMVYEIVKKKLLQ